MYLLDTNVWVSYLRSQSQSIMQRMASLSPSDIVLCSVVLGELYYGALKSARPTQNRMAVDALVAPFVCLPFDASEADEYARIRRHLDALGMPIGPYDLQIAAIALTHGCTLVTHNVAEFQRVPNLTIEDWQGQP